MRNRRVLAVLCVAPLFFGAISPLCASPLSHAVDGAFTTASEWQGENVSRTFFPVVGQTGGAFLYVEQGFAGEVIPLQVQSPNTLFLMYDYVNSDAPGFSGTNASFDVFFEAPAGPDPADYLVRILPGVNNFSAFERPHGSPAPLGGDGSFDVGPGSGWTALGVADRELARFRTAIGFVASPDLSTPHLVAEFALSINNLASGREGLPGFYDPAPAFWSASAKITGDPPISSAIFQLNPSGSTVVVPALGSNGGPVSRPQDVTALPEPSSLLLLGSGGLLGLTALRRRRRA